MTYTLIVYITMQNLMTNGQSGGPVALPGFHDVAACVDAADQIMKAFDDITVKVRYVCVPVPK